MSGPYTHPRSFTWHGFTLIAPGGYLRGLVCITPRSLWTLFAAVNSPVHPKVYKEIKSCLTQVYLGYLQEAVQLKMPENALKLRRKETWKSSPEWASLEGMLVNGRRAAKGLNVKGKETLDKQGKACLASVLTNGRSHAPDCFNNQQFAGGSYESRLDETSQRLQDQSYQERLGNPDYTAFATNQNPSSFHFSASLVASSPLSSDSSGLEVTARSRNGSLNNNTTSKKRSPISYDADNEPDQHMDKKLKYEDYRITNLPLLGDSTSNDVRYFPCRPLVGNPRLSPVTDDLTGYKSRMEISGSIENKPAKKDANVQPLAASAYQQEKESQRFNAISCTADVASEMGATLWLSYNVGGLLKLHPPTVPANVKTLDAMQQTLPYLFSLKTRLVSLSSAAEDVRDVTLGKWIREEIGRAIMDTETAWNCVKHASMDQDVANQETENQNVKDQDTMGWNESDGEDDLP